MQVILARHRSTKKVYAIKVLSKSQVMKRGEVCDDFSSMAVLACGVHKMALLGVWRLLTVPVLIHGRADESGSFQKRVLCACRQTSVLINANRGVAHPDALSTNFRRPSSFSPSLLYMYMYTYLSSRSLHRQQIKHVMSERNVLVQALRHPFLVGMYYSFQTADKLYFVLDYVNGGELFFHLQVSVCSHLWPDAYILRAYHNVL